MDKLKQAVNSFGKKTASTDVLTVRETYTLLAALANKETMEIDYPAARLLAEAEAAAATIQAGNSYYGGDRPASFGSACRPA